VFDENAHSRGFSLIIENVESEQLSISLRREQKDTKHYSLPSLAHHLGIICYPGQGLTEMNRRKRN
jgi:hypothetical protein